MIKCLLLRDDLILVTQIEEVGSDVGEPDCKLTNPYRVIKNKEGEYKVVEWIDFSDQKEIMIHSHNILTIVDPSENILNLYSEIVK
jgi:uncharacterized protein YbaA (DUF1428 family)